MLTEQIIEQILDRLPALCLGVLGDLFLDRYLDIDAALTEPSIETGLDAYQVVRVRSSPGAAGTIVNNLVALGVGRVVVISLIGDDGEGFELRQELGRLKGVDSSAVFTAFDRRTPTYTKPMLMTAKNSPRELNRLDIKNRTPLKATDEVRLLSALQKLWPNLDALIVLDQVSEPDCGVVTAGVRQRLADLGAATPSKLILADSRERIGEFRNVSLKPNQTECRRATATNDLEKAVKMLADQCERPVFCTRGGDGILVVDPRNQARAAVAGYRVTGPNDSVGAGDSTSAGIACAIAAGVGLETASAFGNLVASITIRKIGKTGTASPAEIRRRWCEIVSP
ncbi:MAG: carbohydrate kinase [Planctomycetes bacterium]|nr:carbohydrate kinase [Planctomycetota bacterium]